MTVILDKTVRFLTNERSLLIKKRDGYLADMNRLAEAKDLVNEQIAELDLVVEILSDKQHKPEPEPTPVMVNSGTGNYNSQLKAESRKWILDVVNKHGAVTSRFIADETGIAYSTVNHHVRHMFREGRLTRTLSVVSEHEKIRGKPPFLYKIVPVVEFREHELDITDNLVER